MPFMDRDNVVEHLAAEADNPPFGDSVLPGTVHARGNSADATRVQKSEDGAAEFSVAVKHGVEIRARQRQGLAQLLQDPLAGRVRGGIEMQNATTSMLDHKEAVEQTEG
jgi:hypothetical protein